MNYYEVNKNIEDINIELLRKYLIRHSWFENKDFPNKKLICFTKLYDGEDFNIYIPINEKFKDYKIRVKDAINNISILEDLSISEIMEDILNSSKESDILSIRIDSEFSKDGNIPLDYGRNAIDGIAKLISATISNEMNPKPYFHKLSKNINKEIRNYQLAQTSVGSYIFNIEIKNEINEQVALNDKTHKLNNDESITPQRNVIKRIQRGLYKLSKNKNELDFQNLYKDGFNANMCDALLNLKYGDYDLGIETSIKWAEGIERPKDIPDNVFVKNEIFTLLEEISTIYKKEEVIEEDNIKGYVIKLERNKNTKNQILICDIVVQTRINNKQRNVKVTLNEDDYNIALDAHKNDLIVSVNGELHTTSSNKMEIINYTKFKIIE